MATHGDKGGAWGQCRELGDPRRPHVAFCGEPGMDRGEVSREVIEAGVCPRKTRDTMELIPSSAGFTWTLNFSHKSDLDTDISI